MSCLGDASRGRARHGTRCSAGVRESIDVNDSQEPSREACATGPARKSSKWLRLLLYFGATYHSSVADAALTFTNMTAAAGITHVQAASPSQDAMTGGAAAGDFDGDGLIDLFFTRVDAPDVLYHNTGDGFVDVSAPAGFTQTLPTNGVAAGDVDNDGDLDLYVTVSQSSRNFLYINDGAGRFTEAAVERGASVTAQPSTTRRGQGAAFGDYDRDGYLDILTSDHSRPTSTSGARLLRNLGAANPGHFEDVTGAAGLDVYRTPLAVPDTSYRFTPMFSDIDRDGATDILYVSDSRTSQLFWNNGDGTFTDGTVAAGVGTDKSGMGSTLGDYDRDGDLDWFITAIFDTPFLGVHPGNRLYRNNGNRTFTDVTTAASVRNSGWGWGTSFFDYDNDADLDLIATDGFVTGFTADRTMLWRNNADGSFADVGVAAGVVDTGQGRGLLHLDYDSDGDLDIVIVNFAAAPILYRNDGGNESNWLRVTTEGTVSNRDGIGALITVTPDADQPQDFQIWEVTSGGSFLSQSELTAHFGLGDTTDSIDLVTIKWPSGELQRFTNIAVNSRLIARELWPADFDGNGMVDDDDLSAWSGAFGLTGVEQGADGNFDGAVDGADLLVWQREVGESQSSGFLAVPEPAAARLALLVGVAALLPRAAAERQRRRGASQRTMA